LIVVSRLVISSEIVHSNQVPQCPSKRLGHGHTPSKGQPLKFQRRHHPCSIHCWHRGGRIHAANNYAIIAISHRHEGSCRASSEAVIQEVVVLLAGIVTTSSSSAPPSSLLSVSMGAVWSRPMTIALYSIMMVFV